MSTKTLGFCRMRLPLTNPDEASSIDVEQVKDMVDAFIKNGFTYFDTAWMYCGFQSECAAKEALVDRYPRDSYTLADKLIITSSTISAWIITRSIRNWTVLPG